MTVYAPGSKLLRRLQALVCLAVAIGLAPPRPAFSQGRPDHGRRHHLRPVEVGDNRDLRVNPNLAGLEEALRRAGQEPVATPETPRPAAVPVKAAGPAEPARTFWQTRGQEAAATRPIAPPSPRLAAGLEEPDKLLGSAEQLLQEVVANPSGRNLKAALHRLKLLDRMSLQPGFQLNAGLLHSFAEAIAQANFGLAPNRGQSAYPSSVFSDVARHDRDFLRHDTGLQILLPRYDRLITRLAALGRRFSDRPDFMNALAAKEQQLVIDLYERQRAERKAASAMRWPEQLKRDGMVAIAPPSYRELKEAIREDSKVRISFLLFDLESIRPGAGWILFVWRSSRVVRFPILEMRNVLAAGHTHPGENLAEGAAVDGKTVASLPVIFDEDNALMEDLFDRTKMERWRNRVATLQISPKGDAGIRLSQYPLYPGYFEIAGRGDDEVAAQLESMGVISWVAPLHEKRAEGLAGEIAEMIPKIQQGLTWFHQGAEDLEELETRLPMEATFGLWMSGQAADPVDAAKSVFRGVKDLVEQDLPRILARVKAGQFRSAGAIADYAIMLMYRNRERVEALKNEDIPPEDQELTLKVRLGESRSYPAWLRGVEQQLRLWAEEFDRLSSAGMEEGKITRREFLAATLGAAATVAIPRTTVVLPRDVGANRAILADRLQNARREAVKAWGGVTVTPPSKDITKRLLPVFYAPETYHAIPLVAKAGSPFLVIAASQTEEDSVWALLDDLKVSRGQYVIRRSDLEKMGRPALLAQVLQEFTHYNTYPVDPSRPAWLEDLLARLQQEGMIPIGDIAPALQATERYFQILA